MYRVKLNTLLIVLMLVSVVPIFGIAVVAVFEASSTAKAASISKLSDTVKPLARAVESELQRATVAVSRLAALAYTSTDAVEKPHSRSFTGLYEFGGTVVTAFVPGRIDDIPLTGSTPRGMPFEAVRRSYASGTAQLSNLYFAENGSPKIAITAPGPVTDKGRFFVALILSPDRLVRLLQGETSPESRLLIAVTDGNGKMVARSRNAAEFIGKPVPDWNTLKEVKADKGTFEGDSMEGGKIVFAFDSLRQTPGWKIVAGEPKNAFIARWQQPIVDLIVGGIVAVFVATIASAHLSHYIIRSLGHLTRFAHKAADPAVTADKLPDSLIAEFQLLGRKLQESQNSIQDRTLRLTTSERRYRALAEVGTLVFWTQTLAGLTKSATGWQDLTGGGEEQAIGHGWRDFIHPDDNPRISPEWYREARRTGVIDIEFRIRTVDGDWRWVRSRGGLVDSSGDEEEEWVGVLEDVDTRRKAQDRLAYMALHDTLTGLGNRAMLFDRLQTPGAGQKDLLFLDLDRFKLVNDTLGHAIGDGLLCAVAARLLETVGPGDFVSRLGGDEFAVVTERGSGKLLASKLIQCLAKPFQVQEFTIAVGTSVGISTDGGSAETVLREADLALNVAKNEARGSYRVFEPQMYEKARQRSLAEADLRRAVDRTEWEVYYQPLVNPSERRLAGFEALLRWNHPERGVRAPADFIDLAEELGLIVPIGAWVLENACIEAAKWPSPLKVAINVSGAQLRDFGFIDSVMHALDVSGLEPGRLELEISENAVMENLQTAMAALLRLKLIGCSIAMDDFGSGGSSLAYLRSFPFTRVKIDKSFVLNLGEGAENGTIVRAVTSICNSLGITSTGEGVETEEQLDFLTKADCSEVQGYLFGKATPASGVSALIAKFGIADAENTGSRRLSSSRPRPKLARG